jgi:hypothetical protein|tara:strand:+ start:171 stop:380 length:210 start_codon:yes stop_codon:yes gene_type:complete
MLDQTQIDELNPEEYSFFLGHGDLSYTAVYAVAPDTFSDNRLQENHSRNPAVSHHVDTIDGGSKCFTTV